MDNNKNIEKLLDFVRDTESLEKLSEWTNKLNIFDVLKISRTEIRHSNMLAWLLDPNENHGLDCAFLFGIIAKISSLIDDEDKKFVLKLLTSDLCSFSIFRERYNIDILLVSVEQKTVIAIENKIGSKEHDSGKSGESQLQKYSKVINEKYKGYNKYLIYLTPEGDIPSVGGWEIMNYSDILAVLVPVFESRKNNLGTEVRLLIENYIETIKRNVIMDENLVKLCNDIYSKHKDAIDLIIENKDDKCMQVSNICRKKLEEYKQHGIEIFGSEKTKAYIRFTTENLRNLLKRYKKVEVFFQFQIRAKDDFMRFELVCHNLGIRNIDELINDIMPWVKRKGLEFDKNWVWKRVWSEKRDDLENASDAQIGEWIEKKIKESLAKGK